ncbi:proteasome assembly chaperone family protein [Phycisphaerales bacterium AB-hyl4]|uniref:Proteasome assembly chaperone family protein n=1 Tax=Natronomicrosphaera hydrolytica TaxID=3242702 RepID=A0ABV4TZD9_9BACT
MSCPSLHLEREAFPASRMLLGFAGWMDGGDVSTGTAEWLIEQHNLEPIAEIMPDDFFLQNFPGSMEITAMFRPHAVVEDGMIKSYEPPTNTVYWSQAHDLLVLMGNEPHLRWEAFADCLWEVVKQAGVREMYFVGSVAGVVPHTRDPRMRCTVSDESLKPRLEKLGVRFTSYEGPASFATHLMQAAPDHNVQMTNLVTEIPAYIQGRNPKGIETVLRQLGTLTDLSFELDDLRSLGDHWEKRINEAIAERQDLAEHIGKLEEDYDHEVFDTQMGDLKDWLEQQGIQVD